MLASGVLPSVPTIVPVTTSRWPGSLADAIVALFASTDA
jgi:hypothetical protein